MIRRALLLLALLLVGGSAQAQIVNRLKIDDPTFQRYASGRMQLYSPANLTLADSIYQVGVERDDFRYKSYGLALEIPVRFAQGEYDRMDAAFAEIKEIHQNRVYTRDFYFSVIHDYCQFLIRTGRATDAMLEAREMQRTAEKERNPLGKMYACRIIALIQSYRSNSFLAIDNYLRAARYCKDAKAEQELPNLYILIAQEFIRDRDFVRAEQYCTLAEDYLDFFPSLRIKTRMTRAWLYDAEGDKEAFGACYDALVADPLYTVQAEPEARCEVEVAYLRSQGRIREALEKAGSAGTARNCYRLRHGLYALLGEYNNAYDELSNLMAEKDSIYIRVQNEDMAILDAEMNNAQLRQDAERLKAQNQITILLGFLVMFAIAFVSILVSQWRLRENLHEMKQKNNQMLMARRAYQSALDAKEAENAVKIKILQNRKSNTLKL